VRSDIVLIEAGNGVPADLRLVEAPRLKINEAALTGEAVPAKKRSASIQRSLPAVVFASLHRAGRGQAVAAAANHVHFLAFVDVSGVVR
jgi:P-type E1-E2 ATPase